MTTRRMVTNANTETAARRRRLRAFLNMLALAPKRIARRVHCCQLCALPIPVGEEYRDGGFSSRAHEVCFQAVNKEVK